MTVVIASSSDRDVPDDPEATLRAVRQQFVQRFLQRCDSFALLIERAASTGQGDRSLVQLVHRMVGMAGMIGLPEVSVRARDLEEILTARADGVFDLDTARSAVVSLRRAFEADLAAPPPSWSVVPAGATMPSHVLVVEDDPEQLAIITAALRHAGHRVVGVDRGDAAIARLRELRPDLILLDLDLPGASGLDVCAAIRADPDTHDIPVVFVTARAAATDRVAGLTAGADDYLIKPVDPAELLLRMDLLRRRSRVGPKPFEPVLTYDAFAAAAATALGAGPIVLALLRLPREGQEPIITRIAAEVRRRDLVGRYDDVHLLILFPETTAADAVQRVTALAAVHPDNPVHAGVAAAPDGASLREMLERADEALAEARYRRLPVVLHGREPEGARAPAPTVVVAEDDPDVMRILDTRLQASGYRTRLVFDGEQALAAIGTQSPDLVILDLMMPRLTGFDVLAEIRRQGWRKPAIVVISARGREADVTRAFELGADDYLTKPFGPQELLARLARLTR